MCLLDSLSVSSPSVTSQLDLSTFMSSTFVSYVPEVSEATVEKTRRNLNVNTRRVHQTKAGLHTLSHLLNQELKVSFLLFSGITRTKKTC